MKYKTAELEGALLDAAVARAEGWYVMNDDELTYGHRPWTSPINGDPNLRAVELGPLQWSTDWRIAGPIIQRERIVLGPTDHDAEWIAYVGASIFEIGGPPLTGESHVCDVGPTALIAAMRAYVGSKLGQEVELP